MQTTCRLLMAGLTTAVLLAPAATGRGHWAVPAYATGSTIGQRGDAPGAELQQKPKRPATTTAPGGPGIANPHPSGASPHAKVTGSSVDGGFFSNLLCQGYADDINQAFDDLHWAFNNRSSDSPLVKDAQDRITRLLDEGEDEGCRFDFHQEPE